MDNMKNLKGLVALVLALTMIVGMVGTVLAEGNTNLTGATTDQRPTIDTNAGTGEFLTAPLTFKTPAENTITASGIDSGDTVSYYQLLVWSGSSTGTTSPAGGGWQINTAFATELASFTVAQLIDGINVTEAAAIATALKNATATGSMTETSTAGTYQATPVTAGLYYLKAVANSDTTIYNPAFVSADYYDGNNTVSFSNTIGTSAVVKKSTLKLDKAIVGNANEVGKQSNPGVANTFNDVHVGSVVPYKVTTQIPTYSAEYVKTSLKFDITDTFSKGLKLKVDTTNKFSVKLGSADPVEFTSITDNTPQTATGKFTFTPQTDDDGTGGFVVSFDQDYLADTTRGIIAVEITYYGEVTANATIDKLNVAERDNTVELEFTHKPGQDNAHLKDRTRHYTFAIDGNLLGSSSEDEYTNELIKTGVNQDGTLIYTETEKKKTFHSDTVNPLAGATFQLVGIANTETAYYTAHTYQTTGDGRIYFNNLDAGSYELTEVSAPDGFVKDPATYIVTITPTYATDEGTDDTVELVLTGYEIKIQNKDDATIVGTSSFTVTNTGTTTEKTTTSSSIEDATNFIQNRRGVELPSTGGIGTTIFYIVGVVMVLGAAAVMVARRKSEQE